MNRPGQAISALGAVMANTNLRRVELAWGASAPEVGREVQRRVADYLERMAGARPQAVDVVVDEIGPAP